MRKWAEPGERARGALSPATTCVIRVDGRKRATWATTHRSASSWNSVMCSSYSLGMVTITSAALPARELGKCGSAPHTRACLVCLDLTILANFAGGEAGALSHARIPKEGRRTLYWPPPPPPYAPYDLLPPSRGTSNSPLPWIGVAADGRSIRFVLLVASDLFATRC
ncbi:hypothetical protein U9M48_024689 [Paspalum notatum var. saurae]|uniref:Uncharacterized protein n=1 Tax=Paspalum notatum var. saurae TaxID=547442 RepID=A0AAQ3TPB4_PASNO